MVIIVVSSKNEIETAQEVIEAVPMVTVIERNVDPSTRVPALDGSLRYDFYRPLATSCLFGYSFFWLLSL
jgi:hypothetical protein